MDKAREIGLMHEVIREPLSRSPPLFRNRAVMASLLSAS